MDDYFDFFDIDVAFNIDTKALRQTFIANSKKYHPDFYTLQDEGAQENALEKATVNNKAWKTLSDPQKRMAHILELNNVMPEEGKAQIPQSFLMEMMDINEALMELEFGGDESKKGEILQSIDNIVQSIEAEGEAAMVAWDADKEEGLLEVVRDYHLKLKYIGRIKQRLR